MVGTDLVRDEAISDILAMTPAMRDGLRAALDRLPAPTPPSPEAMAASRAAKSEAGRKLGSGLAKLRAASEAIRSSRQGPVEAEA